MSTVVVKVPGNVCVVHEFPPSVDVSATASWLPPVVAVGLTASATQSVAVVHETSVGSTPVGAVTVVHVTPPFVDTENACPMATTQCVAVAHDALSGYVLVKPAGSGALVHDVPPSVDIRNPA